jgi:hypothetical protein
MQKEIEGYPQYKITEDGEVWSYQKNTPRPLKPGVSKLGYKLVCLGRNNPKTLHRLLAKTFIPNPENKPCVNHIDGNKLNNNLSNLEWVSYSENNKHAFKTGLRIPSPSYGGKHGCANPVIQYDLAGNELNRFSCIVDAEKHLGIAKSNISAVCRGKHKSCLGFKWKYSNEVLEL